jgi:mannosyl-oligosaccharide glucosidase
VLSFAPSLSLIPPTLCFRTRYLRENSPGDVAYWRGPIWINCNYLAVDGLTHYASLPGPHQERAAELLKKLSRNLAKNIGAQWEETGFLWEQYNPKDGKGQRTHPFNGWSSLVVLAMAGAN